MMKRELARLQGTLLDNASVKEGRKEVKARVKALKKQLRAAVLRHKADDSSSVYSGASSSAMSDASTQAEIEKIQSELNDLKETLLSLPDGTPQKRLLAQASSTAATLRMSLAQVAPGEPPKSVDVIPAEGCVPPISHETDSHQSLEVERDLLRAKRIGREHTHAVEVHRMAQVLDLVPMLELELEKERATSAELREELRKVAKSSHGSPDQKSLFVIERK